MEAVDQLNGAGDEEEKSDRNVKIFNESPTLSHLENFPQVEPLENQISQISAASKNVMQELDPNSECPSEISTEIKNRTTPTPKFPHSKRKSKAKLLPKAKNPLNVTHCKVYTWGSGKDGRCGNGKENSEKVPKTIKSQHAFTQLSCGYHHSASVSREGLLLTWGRGVFGQLGHGDTENYPFPTAVEALVKT